MRQILRKIAASAILFLAPLAARADLAYDGPPNDYTGFLFRHGYYRWGGLSNAMSGFGRPLVFVVVGGIILLAFRFLLFSASKKAKRVVACSMAVFLVAAIVLSVPIISREYNRMLQVPLFRGWPDKAYRDTPKHRAEYDDYCLSEYKEKGPQHDFYSFRKNIPIPRKDAPSIVVNEYKRIYGATSRADSERRQRAWEEERERRMIPGGE